MIHREAWYLEVVAFEETPVLKGEGRFKPTPPKPGQPLEDWYREQEEAYRKYDINRRHNLRYKHRMDIPRTPEQEEELELEELIRQQELKDKREWNRIYRERKQQRMMEDPEYAKAEKEKRRRWNQQRDRTKEKEDHQRRLKEDPEYAEAFREKMRQRREDNKAKYKEYERRKRERHLRRMEEDPEYAEEFRRKDRERRKRRQEKKK